MCILNRNELIALFKSGVLRIEELEGTLNIWADRDYSWDNPFQQSSIDLTVGSIYVAGTESYDLGGTFNPKTAEHVLETGHTAMIRTREKIIMPHDVGGICFSPSRLALKAILITNMGHVDPGYAGHLHFTAINMGKESYTFRKNDVICSMIFFRLSEMVLPFGEEHFKIITTDKGDISVPAVIANYFPKLSRDFADVEKRAKAVAKSEIDRVKLWSFVVPIAITLIIASISMIQYWKNMTLETELKQLNSKIELLDKKLDYEKRIKNLENRFFKPQKAVRFKSSD